MRSEWRDGDRMRVVEVTAEGGGRYRVTVDGAPFALTAARLADGRMSLTTDQGITIAELTAAGARRFVRLGSLDFVLDRETSGAVGRKARGPRAQGGGLGSPMPGVVTRVMVAAGDRVEKGQPLVALEAMKMEHLIRAPRDGRIRSIAATVGEMVNGGVPLVEMEEDG
jgi:3-methylcrotonyl-CoA carboxylase alpha subunit